MNPTPAAYDGKTRYQAGAEQIADCAKQFRSAFTGVLITNNGHTPQTALETIQAGNADLISFGKLALSNPDLVERIQNNWPFNDIDFKTFYGGGEKGYTDYPYYVPPSVNETPAAVPTTKADETETIAEAGVEAQ